MRYQHNTVEHRHPEECHKSDTCGYRQVQATNPQEKYPARQCKRQVQENQPGIAHFPEHHIKQPHDDEQHERHDDIQVSHGALLIFKSPAVGDEYAGRHVKPGVDGLLEIGNRGAYVDIPQVDAYDNTTLTVFSGNLARSFLHADFSHAGEGDEIA